MILSDRDIIDAVRAGHLTIDPFDVSHVQPASVDLTLSNTFRVLEANRRGQIDLREQPEYSNYVVEDQFVLEPRELVLAATKETFGIPDDLVGVVEGKSSLARLGLLVHVTAGYFDPGFVGGCTLELANLTEYPMTLYTGMFVCQMAFMRLSSPAERPYGSSGLHSKYAGQVGPTGSRFYTQFAE